MNHQRKSGSFQPAIIARQLLQNKIETERKARGREIRCTQKIERKCKGKGKRNTLHKKLKREGKRNTPIADS